MLPLGGVGWDVGRSGGHARRRACGPRAPGRATVSLSAFFPAHTRCFVRTLAWIPAVPFVAASMLVSLSSPARAASYAFAEQKIFGMTFTAAPGSTATISGDPMGFSVKMSTDAAITAIGTGISHNGGLDALQSYVTPALPAAPVENYSGPSPVGFSMPTGERVLLQLVTTAPGSPNGFSTADPVPGNFTVGQNFARSDAYATPNPNIGGVAGQGFSPADVPVGSWPIVGNNIPSSKLFAPIGTPGTLSIDTVAEVLMTDQPHNTIGTGVSDWTVTGAFSINGSATDRAVVSLDFNLVERLVVFSDPYNDNKADASNRLALDIFDAAGRSVFGPFLGTNPSSARMLTSISTFAETYNNATFIPSHLYPGPNVVNFQTLPLGPGRYTYEIKGSSTARAVSVPEPSAATAVGSTAAVLLVAGWRRTRRLHQIG